MILHRKLLFYWNLAGFPLWVCDESNNIVCSVNSLNIVYSDACKRCGFELIQIGRKKGTILFTVNIDRPGDSQKNWVVESEKNRNLERTLI